MKILTICFTLISIISLGQNGIIDTYNLDLVNRNPGTGNIPSGPYPVYINNSLQSVYDSQLPLISNGYTGEYMIYIREHPIYEFRFNHAISYKIEVVSYPFTINCWNLPTSCASPVSPSSIRNLNMPDGTYDNTTHSWGVSPLIQNRLLNLRENGEINLPWQNGLISGGDGHPEQLVTVAFKKDGFVAGSNYSSTIPHTVLKQTVYFHCSNTYISNKIDSIVWVYDNTRGRMRNYPFRDNNDHEGAHPTWWDVVFVPEIISKPQAHHLYNESDNSWLDGGSINYFPFDLTAINNNCPGTPYLPASEYYEFRYFTPPDQYITQYPCPPPYSLLSSFLRSGNIVTPAGYVSNNGLMTIPDLFFGIPHTYYIDHDFDWLNDGFIDLSIINPSNKIIYNPSEVMIDPDKGGTQTGNPITVIFPENYTFKTTLGRFPSEQEISDANNDPQNGGPYADLREVPVPVNAADLPQSPNTNTNDYPPVMWDDPLTIDLNNFDDDERYGYYKIKNKASVFVDKCVKIFDARFLVEEGGTLEFYDRSTTLGYENVTIPVAGNNYGRYKIRGEGGAILRNYENIQYVQNGNIIQLRPLHYIAWDAIEAGEQVDPNTDQPSGNYSIMPGSDVTFQTQGYIHLTNGFSVQGGDFHALVSDNIESPTACAAQNRSGQQSSPINQSKRGSELKYKAICTPNPNNGNWTLEAKSMQSYVVTNLIGQELLRNDVGNSNSEQITVPPDSKGLHFVKVTSKEGKTAVVKVVVE